MDVAQLLKTGPQSWLAVHIVSSNQKRAVVALVDSAILIRHLMFTLIKQL